MARPSILRLSRWSRRHRRDERGAVAVMTILLLLVLFVAAALAVDVTSQSMTRQDLHNTLDLAAHAGAYELPDDGVAARAKALSVAHANDPSVDPAVDLWCVVASTGTTPAVKQSQIPATCNPGPAPFTEAAYPGLRCNAKVCAIPCVPEEGDVCNTVRVSDSKVVPYAFAPVIGVTEGDTGAVSSSACKGGCGAEATSPMDIVVVADRTPSMVVADRDAMVAAIKGMLLTLDPTKQYVALATIHKTVTATTTCPTQPTLNTDGPTAGKWIAAGFSNSYLKAAASPPALEPLNPMVQGLTCMSASNSGTHLASALKGAARYLLGYDANNLSTLPSRDGTVRKVIVFETDGMPDENYSGGSTALTAPGDVAAGFQKWLGGQAGNGVAGCENLRKVADQAKAAGITIVTIGFGRATSTGCERVDYGTQVAPYARDYLAKIASPGLDGSPSVADNTCQTANERLVENGDGDLFFCAVDGPELGPIFASAIATVTRAIRLIELP
jgi:Flp pilus assembly protein TadG